MLDKTRKKKRNNPKRNNRQKIFINEFEDFKKDKGLEEINS